MKKIWIYLATGAVALFVFKSFMDKREPQSGASSPEIVSRQKKGNTPTEATKAHPARSTTTLAAKGSPDGAAPPILQAFKAAAGNIVFSIKTENVGCSLGDFNMMAADASMRGTKKVLLSVESLNDRDARPLLSENVPLSDFIKGREWVVPTAPKRDDMPLGVFICSDKAGTGRCLGKDVMDINELWAAYQKTQGGKGSYPTQDHVLMFQYLHRQGEGVQFLPADSLQQFGGESVKSTLVALNGEGSQGQRVAQDIYRYLDILKPMPGRLNRDSILFPLPNAQCR